MCLVSAAARRKLITTKSSTLKAKSAYGEFRKERWDASVKVGQPGFGEEQRRVTQLWKALSVEEVAHYQTLADNRNNMLDANGVATNAAGSDFSTAGVPTSYGYRAVNRQAIRRAVEAYVNHPAWGSGLNLSGPAGPLRADLIDMTTTQENVSRRARKLCEYDRQGIENPRGTHKPETTCAEIMGSRDCCSGPAGSCVFGDA